jgi:hypothetical protein
MDEWWKVRKWKDHLCESTEKDFTITCLISANKAEVKEHIYCYLHALHFLPKFNFPKRELQGNMLKLQSNHWLIDELAYW